MKKFLKSLFYILIATIAVNVLNASLSSKDSSIDIDSQLSAISLPIPTETEKVYPEFYDLLSLRDFMNEEKSLGNFEVTFHYSGTEDLTAVGVLAKMTASMSVNYSYSGDLYTVTMRKYPGEKIVEAYRTGDTSQLNEDELLALERAEEIVNFGIEQAADPLELEQFLHDVIAEEVTYYTDDRMNDFEQEDAPRYLSVIGALLDGQANCQGYSDAFYTLASMAGFQVSKMSVEAPEGGHQVNTICLNGNWYVVDVTYDDNDDDSFGTHYGRFNIGRDLIKDYQWEDIFERVPIAQTTDPALYYYSRNGLVYESVSDFSLMIAQNWLETGQTTFHGMVRNEANGDMLTETLSAALDETGSGYSYRYLYSCNSQDCFYTVLFE